MIFMIIIVDQIIHKNQTAMRRRQVTFKHFGWWSRNTGSSHSNFDAPINAKHPSP